MSQLDDIKARAEKAIEGPWFIDGDGVTVYYVFHNGDTPDRDRVAEASGPNADFIANARTDVPKLVAALEAVDAISKRVSQQAVDMYTKARVLPFDERAVAAANAVEFEVIATDIYAAIEEALS